jgi:hypothetical protein
MHGSSLVAADLVILNAVLSQVTSDLGMATVIVFTHTCYNGVDVIVAVISQQLQDVIDAVLMASVDVMPHKFFTSIPFGFRYGCFGLDFKERRGFGVAAVAWLRADADRSTAPVGAPALLAVESVAFTVLIAGVGAVRKTRDMVVLAVVCEVTICPIFDPVTAALARCHIVAINGVA